MRYGPTLLPTSWIGVVAMCVYERRPDDHTCATWRCASETPVQAAPPAHPTARDARSAALGHRMESVRCDGPRSCAPRAAAAARFSEPAVVHLAPTDAEKARHVAVSTRAHGCRLGPHAFCPSRRRRDESVQSGATRAGRLAAAPRFTAFLLAIMSRLSDPRVCPSARGCRTGFLQRCPPPTQRARRRSEGPSECHRAGSSSGRASRAGGAT